MTKFSDKICTDLATLKARVTALPRPVVFTNGCFDILHHGHVSYLEAARALGASLVVGVNSDASVRRQNKAPDRPLNELADRMAVLAALESVSLVVGFDETVPMRLVAQVAPDIHAKGGDYTLDQVPEAAQVVAAGGQFVSLPFLAGRSTSGLIQRIRDKPSPD